MATHKSCQVPCSVWLVDSGCSNHMTGVKEFFSDLDETQKVVVRLVDNKVVQVEGKGTVIIKTAEGQMKTLKEVQYAPSLAHNLLSVGQLILSGYSLVFDEEKCIIKDQQT